MKNPALLAAALLVASLPAAARADDEGLARTLAEQGKAAVDKGDDATGCPKLAEAWRLDAQLLGAGFAVAGCHERQGRLASAWTVYSSVAGKARVRGEARAEEAQKRADALKPRLSTLTLSVPEGVRKLDGLVVTRDGQTVGAPIFETAVPVDGGKHTVTAAAVGRQEWQTTVDVPVEGGRIVVNVAEPPLEAPKKAGPAPAPPPPPPPPPPEGVRPIVVGAAALGIIGAVTIAVGVGLGVEARNQYDGAVGCDGNVCAQPGLDTRRNALTVADGGTAAFIAGSVVAATGLALGVAAYVTGKKPPPAAARGLVLRF